MSAIRSQLTVAAKPGEVWAFSIAGEEVLVGIAVLAGFLGEIEFRTVTGRTISLPTTVYTDARRVWPEKDPEWEYGIWEESYCGDGVRMWGNKREGIEAQMYRWPGSTLVRRRVAGSWETVRQDNAE